ncbi:MAG TPA: single-stranded DNA-binding protein [Candidatus Cloacimonetes bacterium]|jgi:single-strand DNA-binding protein|nr:single-stranded DNA-binding protein [Candidatus Cloacimonas sp.]HHZ15030.1 single-stranded DNA-binding protein [Candidatus Cloacimonadota bacterium]
MADLRLPRLNRVIICGRITHDLELKFTPKGTPVLRFSLANDRNYRDESGEWQTQTSFFDVVVWSERAENLTKYAGKGTAVLVEGRLEARTYTDQNNINRKIWEIVADSVQALEWRPREDSNVQAGDIPLPDDPSTGGETTSTTDNLPF